MVGKRSDRTAQWLMREASGIVLALLVVLLTVVPAIIVLVEWVIR